MGLHAAYGHWQEAEVMDGRECVGADKFESVLPELECAVKEGVCASDPEILEGCALCSQITSIRFSIPFMAGHRPLKCRLLWKEAIQVDINCCKAGGVAHRTASATATATFAIYQPELCHQLQRQ